MDKNIEEPMLAKKLDGTDKGKVKFEEVEMVQLKNHACKSMA